MKAAVLVFISPINAEFEVRGVHISEYCKEIHEFSRFPF